MVKGKQAIQSLWTEASKGLQIAIKVTDVRSLGPNAAREQGYATIKTRGDNPQEMLGKYVVIWEKVDGKWKVDSDIWNMNSRPETMKTAAGSGDIYWSVTFSIPQGKMDNFKQVVARLVDETKKEPGTLEYEYTANNEQNTVDIIERYQDSNAVVQHVTQTFAKFAKEFLENAQVGRFVVYDAPNDEVKKVLKDFNPVYFSAFDGFTR